MNDNRLGIRATLWLILFGWLLGAAVYEAAAAKADPVDTYVSNNANRVCVVLAAFPSFDGIAGIARAIVADNPSWGYRQAGRIIADSVLTTCPEYSGLLNSFVAVYTPKHNVGVVA